MIDLTGHDEIKFSYAIDIETEVCTITFLSADGLTNLGLLKIEGAKLNSFLKAQSESVRSFIPPITGGQIRQSTTFRVNQLEGTTRFG